MDAWQDETTSCMAQSGMHKRNIPHISDPPNKKSLLPSSASSTTTYDWKCNRKKRITNQVTATVYTVTLLGHIFCNDLLSTWLVVYCVGFRCTEASEKAWVRG